jgi:hypothetical protein
MVMFEPSPNDMIEMRGAEENEMAKTLATNRADEAFDERLRVRRHRRTGNRLDAMCPQRRIKGIAELSVTIALNVSNPQAIGACSPHKVLGLSRNPRGIGGADPAPVACS